MHNALGIGLRSSRKSALEIKEKVVGRSHEINGWIGKNTDYEENKPDYHKGYIWSYGPFLATFRVQGLR